MSSLKTSDLRSKSIGFRATGAEEDVVHALWQLLRQLLREQDVLLVHVDGACVLDPLHLLPYHGVDPGVTVADPDSANACEKIQVPLSSVVK